jgi:hypothetical protein
MGELIFFGLPAGDARAIDELAQQSEIVSLL